MSHVKGAATALCITFPSEELVHTILEAYIEFFLCFPFENFPIRGKRNKISALSLIHTRRQIRTLCGINPVPETEKREENCVLRLVHFSIQTAGTLFAFLVVACSGGCLAFSELERSEALL